MIQPKLLVFGIISVGCPFLLMNVSRAINPGDVTTNVPANLISQSTPANLQDITGTYKCQGKNADGSIYVGKVDITKKGSVYNLKWLIAKQTFTGIGILQGNVLAVSYYGSFSGVVAYRVENSSRLVGRWTTVKQGIINTETLTR